MIDKIIGFIGAGNMGSAMIGGTFRSCNNQSDHCECPFHGNLRKITGYLFH